MVGLKSSDIILKIAILDGLLSDDLSVSIEDVVDPTVDGCSNVCGIRGSLSTLIGLLVGALSLSKALLFVDLSNLSVDAGLGGSNILRAHNKDIGGNGTSDLGGDSR